MIVHDRDPGGEDRGIDALDRSAGSTDSLDLIPMPTLLVVDDDERTVTVIQGLLAAAGYEVESTADPTIAAKWADAGRKFDLAVLDVVMPRLSGEQLAARLRQHDPDLKILYVTGFDEALFQARPQLWAGEAFLEKPFTPEGLREAVAMALYGRTSPPV